MKHLCLVNKNVSKSSEVFFYLTKKIRESMKPSKHVAIFGNLSCKGFLAKNQMIRVVAE